MILNVTGSNGFVNTRLMSNPAVQTNEVSPSVEVKVVVPVPQGVTNVPQLVVPPKLEPSNSKSSKDKLKSNAANIAAMQLRTQIAQRRLQLRKDAFVEQSFFNLNKNKIQESWINIMRKSKAKDLKQTVELLSQSHERDVDRKDATLQMLVASSGSGQIYCRLLYSKLKFSLYSLFNAKLTHLEFLFLLFTYKKISSSVSVY
jgi:hypothetical protein